jgi:ferredoxin
MANPNARHADNVPGRYYVDQECIDCDICRDVAPDNFRRNLAGEHSYVFKQPENEREEELCREALVDCPVQAIGDDGLPGALYS